LEELPVQNPEAAGQGVPLGGAADQGAEEVFTPDRGSGQAGKDMLAEDGKGGGGGQAAGDGGEIARDFSIFLGSFYVLCHILRQKGSIENKFVKEKLSLHATFFAGDPCKPEWAG
jgi:hypothetical protein